MGTLGLDVAGRRDEVVVSLRGELDAVSAPTALVALTAAAIRGQSVVVDLTELDFLDCNAVGLLLQARVVARGSGSDVVLANSRGSVLRLLTTLGLAGPVVVASCGVLQTSRRSMFCRQRGSLSVPAAGCR
jgi:anti-anti-sigma factor